jgi:hypothetical protein
MYYLLQVWNQKSTVISKFFLNSIFLMWSWFRLEILRLVYKKVLNVELFLLVLILILNQKVASPFREFFKNISKGYLKKYNFVLNKKGHNSWLKKVHNSRVKQ